MWPNTQLKCCLTEEKLEENGLWMYWQSGRAFKTAARVSLSVTLVHIHTHEHIHFTAFFLASDSRHPAMTRGVSLAACKAALNRQKYLFWQTDRLSPSKTCMQLSQGLSYLSPTLWFDFSIHLSLSTLDGIFLIFVAYRVLFSFFTPWWLVLAFGLWSEKMQKRVKFHGASS